MRALTTGNVKAGLDAVRRAKLRSLWTTLGIIIGVALVISVVAIGEGIKQQVGGQIHHLGSNIIIVRPTALQVGGGSGASQSGDLLPALSLNGQLSFKDVNTVTSLRGLAASAPLTIVPGAVQGENGTYRDGFVVGTSPDLPGLLNQSLSSGDFLNDTSSANGAVLGATAAEKMFNEDVPLGHSFSFHGQQFVVEGIFNEFQTSPLDQQIDFNQAIFIPNSVAETLTNSTAPTYEILARSAGPEQPTINRLQAALTQERGGSGGFSVRSGQQDQAANNNILDLLTRLITGVAAISLLVGGIGIMNVMLVSVAERTHEIGIRKAVGATNRQIRNQFLIESTLLSLIGGVVGILLALVVDLVLRLLTNLEPDVRWQIVLGATAVSLLIGIIFGTVPAVKAARRDPIEALRSE